MKQHCPNKEVECRRCKQTGHWARKCQEISEDREQRRRRQAANLVDVEDYSEDENQGDLPSRWEQTPTEMVHLGLDEDYFGDRNDLTSGSEFPEDDQDDQQAWVITAEPSETTEEWMTATEVTDYLDQLKAATFWARKSETEKLQCYAAPLSDTSTAESNRTTSEWMPKEEVTNYLPQLKTGDYWPEKSETAEVAGKRSDEEDTYDHHSHHSLGIDVFDSYRGVTHYVDSRISPIEVDPGPQGSIRKPFPYHFHYHIHFHTL